MMVGAGRSGELLEVGIVELEGRQMIVHAMRARERFLR
jgi:hypothetical protein